MASSSSSVKCSCKFPGSRGELAKVVLAGRIRIAEVTERLIQAICASSSWLLLYCANRPSRGGAWVCAQKCNHILTCVNIGHSITLEVARQYLLNSEHQIDWDAFNTLINEELPFFPQLTFESGTMAMWPDFLKSSTQLFTQWHFTDLPYLPPSNPPGFHPNMSPESADILFAMGDMFSNTLNSSTASSWAKGFALRFIFHLTGDIHQPLHCTSMFSPEFPNGDQGGNLFLLNYTTPEGYSIPNLHALFDSVGGIWASDPHVPVSQELNDYIIAQAKNLTTTYPPSSFPQVQQPINFSSWAQDSHQLAAQYGYDMLTPGATPSESYLNILRPVLLQRVALSGYQMARLVQMSNLVIAGPLPSCDTDSHRTAVISLSICLALVIVIIVPFAFLFGKRTSTTPRSDQHKPLLS